MGVVAAKMDIKGIIGEVVRVLEPIVDQNGLEIVEVTLKSEGNRWILRVTIDCETGVTVGHCTMISRELSVHLDVEDLIPVKYYLEVTSPGLDRPLKNERDFERFAGRSVVIKTYRSNSGKKKIRGILEGIDEGIVQVRLDNGNLLEVSQEDMSSARLDYKFDSD
jgi:ribosome maturation factor RimP